MTKQNKTKKNKSQIFCTQRQPSHWIDGDWG